MISSRDLKELTPEVRAKAEQHVAKCLDFGITLLVYCTYRDSEAQLALYQQGRTTPGKIVTNAKPGESYHNFRLAYDCVPVVNGKPVWDGSDPIWAVVGRLGEEVGLEWAGRWRGKLKEVAHFQAPGYVLADLRRKNV